MQHYMMFPHIDPIIYQISPFNIFGYTIGPISLRWYGLMYLIGFTAAWFLAKRRLHRTPWNLEQLSDLMFYGFLGVILGGRIGYVLFYQFDYFIHNPLYLLRIWEGGMSFHGGLLGVCTAMLFFARRTGTQFLQVGDFIAPLIPIGLGAGRIGNFINGELWGRTTDVPWAMIFPEAGPLPRHPSQLYEFLLEGVVLFTLLWWFSSRPRKRGAIGGMFLLAYGCFRFFIEFFRQPDAQMQGIYDNIVTQGQMLSLPMIALGLYLLLRHTPHRTFSEDSQ